MLRAVNAVMLFAWIALAIASCGVKPHRWKPQASEKMYTETEVRFLMLSTAFQVTQESIDNRGIDRFQPEIDRILQGFDDFRTQFTTHVKHSRASH